MTLRLKRRRNRPWLSLQKLRASGSQSNKDKRCDALSQLGQMSYSTEESTLSGPGVGVITWLHFTMNVPRFLFVLQICGNDYAPDGGTSDQRKLTRSRAE